MGQILLQEAINDAQGVLIGGHIEIKGPPQKMAGRIGEEKLLGGGGIASHVEKYTADSVGCLNERRIDGTGFIGMLKGHFEGIVPKFVEAVGTDLLIADIDLCSKAGEIDIDPVGIFRNRVKKAAVPDDGGIDRIIKAIGIAGLVKGLILMGREVDPEIAFSLWRIGAVAGQQTREGHKV